LGDGTFAPLRRASDNPIAIACFLLLTFFLERPDLSVPCFRSCIARLTLLDALGPYLRFETFLAIADSPLSPTTEALMAIFLRSQSAPFPDEQIACALLEGLGEVA
jgi:hypothetical protein